MCVKVAGQESQFGVKSDVVTLYWRRNLVFCHDFKFLNPDSTKFETTMFHLKI